MKLSTGIDIIEIDRVTKTCERKNFVDRFFTNYEIDYAYGRGRQKHASLAGIFAAKEAFVKALGTGFRTGKWQEIEIRHDELGAPHLILYGEYKNIFEKKDFTQMHLSISHSKNYAVANVILQG